MRRWRGQLSVVTVLLFVLETSSHGAPASQPMCDGNYKITVKADVTDPFILDKKEALEAAGSFSDIEACHEAMLPLLDKAPESTRKVVEENVLCQCDGELVKPTQASTAATEEVPVPSDPVPPKKPEPEAQQIDQQAEVVQEPESCGCDATGAGVWTWALLLPWMRRRRKSTTKVEVILQRANDTSTDKEVSSYS